MDSGPEIVGGKVDFVMGCNGSGGMKSGFNVSSMGKL